MKTERGLGKRFWKSWTVAVLLLLPGYALAKSRLAVVDLASPPSLLGMAGKITRLVADEASREGTYEVIDSNAVKLTLGDANVREIHKCAGAAACISSLVAPLSVARIVVGNIDRTTDSYLVKLWLVDVGANSIVSSIDRRILIASRRLEKDVTEAIPQLLRGEQESLGKVHFVARASGELVSGAIVEIDGEKVGMTPFTYAGKPGKHKLRMEISGYYPIDRYFNVDANATVELELKLVPVPGVKLPPLAQRKVAPAGEGAANASVPTSSLISGGVSLAALSGGFFFGNKAKGLFKRAVLGSDGVRQITRGEALEGKQHALTANVLFGVAGVSLGAAAAFWFFGSSGDAAPDLSLGSEGVSLSGTF